MKERKKHQATWAFDKSLEESRMDTEKAAWGVVVIFLSNKAQEKLQAWRL